MKYIDPPRPARFASCVWFSPGVDGHALSDFECDFLVETAGTRTPTVMGKLSPSGQELVDDGLTVQRYSIPTEGFGERMAERVLRAAQSANDDWFGLDITKLTDLGVLRYEVGHEYLTHMDLVETRPNSKLSIVALLSDPDDYEGGDFEVWIDDEFRPVPRDQGTVIVFPAFLAHRVTRVTAGTRWSLVCWVEGPRFR